MIFTPNGIVTFKKCPECREPDTKVEHGKDIHDLPVHYWHCRECGDSMAIVCFDCPSCARHQMRNEGAMTILLLALAYLSLWLFWREKRRRGL